MKNTKVCLFLVTLVSVCLFSTVSGKPKVIIDTDVDLDDLWAIVYLVKSSLVDVVAVTTSNNGWSDSIYAVPNVLHLLQQLGCSDNVSVAYGASVSLLPPTYYYSPSLPAEELKADVSRFFSCLNQTLDYSLMSSPFYSPELIVSILANSDEPVDLLMLGSSTNLAQAIILNPSIIPKIKTVYFSGGSFKNSSIPSNITFPFTKKTSGSSWNIFVDPLATNIILRSGAPIQMFTSDAQAFLPLNYSQAKYYADLYNVSQFLQDIVFLAPPCGRQTFADFNYWDPSAAAYYEQLATTGTSSFCKETQTTNVLVDLLPNGGFGRTLYGGPEDPRATICLVADNTLFVSMFWERFGGETVCPRGYEVSAAVTTIDLQAEVKELQETNTELARQLSVLQQTNSQMQSAFAELSRQVQALSQQGGCKQDNDRASTNIGFYFADMMNGIQT